MTPDFTDIPAFATSPLSDLAPALVALHQAQRMVGTALVARALDLPVADLAFDAAAVRVAPPPVATKHDLVKLVALLNASDTTTDLLAGHNATWSLDRSGDDDPSVVAALDRLPPSDHAIDDNQDLLSASSDTITEVVCRFHKRLRRLARRLLHDRCLFVTEIDELLVTKPRWLAAFRSNDPADPDKQVALG